TPLRCDTWGGFVYVDMRADGESLEEFLGDAGRILAHFELDKMRYKWRQWCIYPANWKTSIEAFMEPYHTTTTHHQLTAYAEFYAYSKAYGRHSVSGFDQRQAKEVTDQGGSVSRAGKGDDPRVSTYELARENYTTINYSASTDTLIAAAARLRDELPETATVGEVMAHWMASAKADDAARGVIWPEIPPAVMAEAGLAWTLFPNQNILQGVTFALGYRARPYGDDPDMCVFEAYALERYPEGQEPETDWVLAEPTEEHWGKVLAQDFDNMKYVHKGMKSRGFRGALPNPHQEQKIINAHRNLAEFMGTGAPRLLK
ncbi:MAG TPA: SRPBCC family protein, partial [Reyranella sp.]|nr:SRPBCC family protein [Reyranella sp.]